jgi:hypothetical protein
LPTTADGDLVALWKDQSGNGNDVLQATSGNRPVLKLAIFNSKPVVRFARVSAQLMATAASVAHGIGTGDFWLAVVYAPSALSNFNTVFSNGAFAPAFYFPHGPTNAYPDCFLGGSSRDFTASAIAAGGQYLSEVGRISGTVKCWHSTGGAAPAQDATTFALSTSIANATLYVGNDTSADQFNGDIAEILFYKASLNSTDQATLESYLRNKYWGVASVATITANPGSIKVSTTQTITIAGTGTTFTTTAPVFSIAGVAGVTITGGSLAVIDNTHATIQIVSGTTRGTATITDATSGATAPLRIGKRLTPLWAPHRPYL